MTVTSSRQLVRAIAGVTISDAPFIVVRMTRNNETSARSSLLLLHAARRGVSRGWLGVGLTMAVGGHEPLILSHGFFHC